MILPWLIAYIKKTMVTTAIRANRDHNIPNNNAQMITTSSLSIVHKTHAHVNSCIQWKFASLLLTNWSPISLTLFVPCFESQFWYVHCILKSSLSVWSLFCLSMVQHYIPHPHIYFHFYFTKLLVLLKLANFIRWTLAKYIGVEPLIFFYTRTIFTIHKLNLYLLH